MLTRETDYAIRALLCLAQHHQEPVTSTTVLAEEMDIPYRFLRRISLRLVEKGLVVSVRGKQGGLRLAKSPEEITLLDVAQAVDTDAVTLNICLADDAACHRVRFCVVHDELVRIQGVLNQELARVTLAMLAERAQPR